MQQPRTVEESRQVVAQAAGRRQLEAEFRQRILKFNRKELPEQLRWWVHYDRLAPDPRQGGELRTVIEGDKGFPDLVLLRLGTRPGVGRVIATELKVRPHKASQEQQVWLRGLRICLVETYIWTPDDWPLIVATLASHPDDPPPTPPESWLVAA